MYEELLKIKKMVNNPIAKIGYIYKKHTEKMDTNGS